MLNLDSNIRVLASTVDLGTSSISSAFLKLLGNPEHQTLPDGIRRGGLRPLIRASHAIQSWQRGGHSMLFLFNTPTLLGGFVPRWKSDGKRVAILDWTANSPRIASRPVRKVYDQIYRSAFRRLDAVASPSRAFREFYSSSSQPIATIDYPLPYPEHQPVFRKTGRVIRALFVGGDLTRKGGRLLLDQWESSRPQSMTLTLVTSKQNIREIPGAKLVFGLKAGTVEHRDLFRSHDVLILPSLLEPYGYVVMEAINFGVVPLTPVSTGAAEVVSKSGGIVSDSPESCIDSLFALENGQAEIDERKLRVLGYAKGHNWACLEQLRNLFAQ